MPSSFSRDKFAYLAAALVFLCAASGAHATRKHKSTVLGMGHFGDKKCARPAVDPVFTRTDVKEWSAGFVDTVGHPANSGAHDVSELEPPPLPPPPDAPVGDGVPRRIEPERVSRQEIKRDEPEDFDEMETKVVSIPDRAGKVHKVQVVKTTSTQAIPEMAVEHSRYTSPTDLKKSPSELADEMAALIAKHEDELKNQPHYVDGIPYSRAETLNLPGESFIVDWKFDISDMPEYDPEYDYNSAIPEGDRPSLNPADPAYTFFIGDSMSSPNPDPGGYFWAPNFFYRLDPIPDYPTKLIFMARGKNEVPDAHGEIVVDQTIIEKRVAYELAPGYHATKIGEGGASIVYAVHKKPPGKFLAVEIKSEGDHSRILRERQLWAMDNAVELIKIQFWSIHAIRAMQRDHVVLRVLAQLARRVFKPNGKPLIRFVVPEAEGLNRSVKKVKAKDIVRGPKATRVKQMLDDYFSANCDGACQAHILAQFKRWNLPLDLTKKDPAKKVHKILLELGAVERFFVWAHVVMLRVSSHLDTMNIGDLDRNGNVRLGTVDLKHGDNVIWSIEEQMWVGVDG